MSIQERRLHRTEGGFGDVMAFAYEIADEATSFDAVDLDDVELKAARVTAGLDPEKVDRDSTDYLFGVTDVIFHLTFALKEHKSPVAEVIVEENGGDSMLKVIAENPGSSMSALAEKAGEKFFTFGRKFARLKRNGFIEPAIPSEPDRHGWQLTPGAINVFARHEARRIEEELNEKVMSNNQPSK